MTSCFRRAAILTLALSVFTPNAARAQSDASALATAERQVIAGDTLSAIQTLQAAVARNGKDAHAWHRLGMLAWSYTKTSKKSGTMVMDPQMAKLRMVADTALRLAAQFTKDSARYWYDLGKFQLATGNTFVRAGSTDAFKEVVSMASRTGDKGLLSKSLDEQGMRAWRSYDLLSKRAVSIETHEDAASIADPLDMTPKKTPPAGVMRKHWNDFFKNGGVKMMEPPLGIKPYKDAFDNFEKAIAADPTNVAALQHLFMVYAEPPRWGDLQRVAIDAIRQHTSWKEPWLAAGLAAVRLNDMNRASAFFDSAFVRMNDTERYAYQSPARLLPPRLYDHKSPLPDSLQFAQATPELRAKWEKLYWYLAEPRASTRFNEAQLEYFARIVEADLLWSSDDLGLRGADSDRGSTLIRYGTPDWQFNLGGLVHFAYRNDLYFLFELVPTYGIARTPFNDIAARDSMIEEKPMSWDNVKAVDRNVPMQLRTARFRGRGDSTDVVIASAIPTQALLAKSELGGVLPIQTLVEINDPQSQVTGREVGKFTVQGERLPSHVNTWWQRSVGVGTNYVRVEAEQKDVEKAAVSVIPLAVESWKGFIMSDILFTGEPKSTSTAKRWTDLEIKPTVAIFDANVPIGIVWENYGLANDAGNARYRVSVELERTFKNTLKGLGARVVANFRNVVEGSAKGTGSLVVSYDEARPSSDVLVDYLSISLKESVAGTYRMTITVEDLAAHQKTSRTTDFLLVKEK